MTNLSSEEEVLKRINNMQSDELIEYRLKNKLHREEISKRKFRNLISRFIKRVIDLLAGIVGTVILIPLTLVVWILNIVNKENGPVFYEQLRMGKNGKIFRLYKFRSMVVGADRKLKDYLKENPEEAKKYKKYKKLENDPRITKTGKFLRATSLDEWPQFLNLLMGNMSLVGPRPYLPTEIEEMGKYYTIIIKVKPGLTGPWQVAGRSNLTFEDRLKLDEEYCSRCGNRRDLRILLKTVKKVFLKDGAI